MPVLPKAHVLLRALAAVLVGVVLLAGCSGTDEAGSGDAGTASAEAGSAGGGADGDAGAGAGAGGGGGAGSLAAPALLDLRTAAGDAVIRTADLAVRVEDVQAAADRAARLARAVGGRVEAEDRTGSGADSSATVQLRVPPVAFDETVADLAALGEERSRRISSDVVGDVVVDLEARLATQRASVARVRALLEEAQALGDVVQIEGELTRRTADLEALEARLEGLEAQIELSTIVVRFDSEDGPVVGSALGFGDGLRSGWAAITTVARVLAVTAGALLPFLPVVLLVGYLVVRARRPRPVA